MVKGRRKRAGRRRRIGPPRKKRRFRAGYYKVRTNSGHYLTLYARSNGAIDEHPYHLEDTIHRWHGKRR